MRQAFILTALVSTLYTTSAHAQDRVVVHPVRLDDESIRFYKGAATIDIDRPNGAVQVSPLPMDHGSFSFSVAVLNKGYASTDFDVGDVTVEVDGVSFTSLTKDELERRAKNRAMWASLAVAVAGGLASGLAASQRDYSSTSLITPRGTYYAFSSRPSIAGQMQSAAIMAGTTYTLVNIQEGLDRTRAALGDAIVQRTTVDPGEGYAGQVILQKIKFKTLPQNMVVKVRWNGEDYRFGFVVGKRGMPAPAIAPMPHRPPVSQPHPIQPPIAGTPHPAPQPVLGQPVAPPPISTAPPPVIVPAPAPVRKAPPKPQGAGDALGPSVDPYKDQVLGRGR